MIDLDPICQNCGSRLHFHIDTKLGKKCSETSTSYFPPRDIPQGWYGIVYRQHHVNFFVMGGACSADMAGHEQEQHGSGDDVFFVPITEATFNSIDFDDECFPILFEKFEDARNVAYKQIRGFPSKRVTSVGAVGTRNQPKELFVIEYIPGDGRWYPMLQKDVPAEIVTNTSNEQSLSDQLSGLPIERLSQAVHAAISHTVAGEGDGTENHRLLVALHKHLPELFGQPGFGQVYLVHFADGHTDHRVYDTPEQAKAFVEKERPGPTWHSVHEDIPHNWDESNAHGLIWYWGPGQGKEIRDRYIAYVEEITVKTSTGPGSTSDKAKALLQLETRFATYPGATGYSHLAGLLLRDAAFAHGAGDYVKLARLVSNLKHEDMRFLWDESAKWYKEAVKLSDDSVDTPEMLVNLRRATSIDRIREILVNIREVVTGEQLSYPESGGVEARKLR